MHFPKKMGLVAALGLWTCGVIAAFGAMVHYASKPGAEGSPNPQAAADFYARHGTPGRPLLVMAVHPRCPCTSASLDEMTEMLGRIPQPCDVVLLVYQASGWPNPGAVRRLGGVSVPIVADRDGKTAQALGAFTSGHCLLFGPDGRVRFYGGITIARGHRGKSPAQDAILDIVRGGDPKLTVSPVYGCSITNCTEAKKP